MSATLPPPASRLSPLKKHTLAVLVNNESGVLARVVGLFSGRGYNIESLTVSEVDAVEGISRITIVTIGTDQIVEQIKAQLGRLVPVYRVADLTASGALVEHELALIKIAGTADTLQKARRIADDFAAREVDATPTSFIIEMTGEPEKINELVVALHSLGLIEVVRTGVVAITRGATPL
jgi:acetolactate synthase-1/3 small subunit